MLQFNYNSYTSVIKTQDWIFNDEGYAVTNKSPKMLSTDHSPKYLVEDHDVHMEFYRGSW